jgi:uncharacterized protein YndB with AHSA1/START domain
MTDEAGTPLIVRRTIHAPAVQLFTAWTEPEHLKKWWGPRPVTCSDAQVDLRVGGEYRIANQFPDGTVLWIAGTFESIEPPGKLIYSWRIESQPNAQPERVTVEFIAQGASTEVVITHERIHDEAARTQHLAGWEGCLDGLSSYHV